MMYDLLLNNIAKHIQLDVEDIEYFKSILTYKEVPRKTILLKADQSVHFFYFVQQGALRAYHSDEKGKETTVMFALSDWWITDMYCFQNQLPSMVTIECIEDSCIFLLQKNKMDTLLASKPKFERYFRILFQNAYTREQLRVIENLSLSAKERYDRFVLKYPQVVQQVAQKQIASYLGITPEFLSTIRNNKIDKKDHS